MGIEYPIAVISDIHANVEALQAVLEDIRQRGVQHIICLGDLIGYGPNPRECLDLLIEHCDWSLMGNHDFAVLYEPTSFNATAEAASFWTRRRLETEPDAELRAKRFNFLGNLRLREDLDGILCVHGSPRRPIHEYIFADDVLTAPMKIEQVFDRIDRVCLVGHTHVQGLFTDEPDFYPPDELGFTYKFSEHERVIINVGSVGQPRDRDPRSAYGILFQDHIDFLRVEYDVEAVMRKVQAIPELSDFLGQRLLEGR